MANVIYASLAMIKPSMEHVSLTDSKLQISAVSKEDSTDSAKNALPVSTLRIIDAKETPSLDVWLSSVQPAKPVVADSLWPTTNVSESSKDANSTTLLEPA